MPMKVVFETALDQTWSPGSTSGQQDQVGDKIGDLRWEGSKCYKCVKYNKTSGNDGVAGEATYYNSVDGYKDNVVTSDLSVAETGMDTDTGAYGAGILVANVVDLDICWIQIKGLATMSIALQAGSDGDALTPKGAQDGNLDLNVVTAANTHICAYSMDVTDKEIVCDFPF